ncbi:hypothetical protein [Bradyrhizobium sp. 192]|uniref:hypothetical protein n=1 Tax=Bradyrhizobium sp. 192 TaxID=2782660 RepID=UPI001FFFE401|nr:hypothetical protein [Bradyrhizobium sp. 192]UPJ60289.1 hypothetical protein IVB24_11995 [Bradyrhizobium sp. 192]
MTEIERAFLKQLSSELWISLRCSSSDTGLINGGNVENSSAPARRPLDDRAFALDHFPVG